MIDYLQLEATLPLFTPTQRHVIMLNNYDRFPSYSQTKVEIRGNRRVYQLEALLQGRFCLGPTKQRQRLREELPRWFDSPIKAHQKCRTPRYDSVTRILPRSRMNEKLCRIMRNIAQRSDLQTLTFLYLTSHGEPGGFTVDDTQSMQYQKLLMKLDVIKGKKVIIALACYSGSLIDVLEKHEHKGNYIAITSTNNHEEGINWAEDKIHDIIINYLTDNRRLTQWQLPSIVEPIVGEMQHPQIKGYYDVIL